jgi:hypothetical protein
MSAMGAAPNANPATTWLVTAGPTLRSANTCADGSSPAAGGRINELRDRGSELPRSIPELRPLGSKLHRRALRFVSSALRLLTTGVEATDRRLRFTSRPLRLTPSPASLASQAQPATDAPSKETRGLFRFGEPALWTTGPSIDLASVRLYGMTASVQVSDAVIRRWNPATRLMGASPTFYPTAVLPTSTIGLRTRPQRAPEAAHARRAQRRKTHLRRSGATIAAHPSGL